MSMNLYLMKLAPALAERIVAQPDLLGQILGEDEIFDSDIAAMPDDDVLLEDYLGIARALDEEPQRYSWTRRAVHGTGREIAFDYGYGPAFVISVQEGSQIAAGLTEEVRWRPGEEVLTIGHAIAAFYSSAAKDGRIIIGCIG